MAQDESWSALRRDVVRAFLVPAAIAALLIGIEVLNTLLMHRLNAFGVVPRTGMGLVGVLAMPLLHGGFDHVLGNSTTLLLFGPTMLLMRPKGEFARVTVVAAIAGGLCAWLLGGSGSHHVGYSGVLFGYFGHLLAVGFFERKIGSVLLSLTFGAIYGVMVFGVLPGQPGISWEGHMGGFLGGLATAAFAARRSRQPQKPAAPKA
jgi:membrane associated rhomboid family serine protease